MSRSTASAQSKKPHVAQINVSNGGVPKLPVPSADVNERGIVTDRQADSRYHGSPEQALCLYSLELIEALQGEGHPIKPGSAGENITASGLDWQLVVPGCRLRIGEVLAEATDWAPPCQKNARWFSDGDVTRISHELHPGWSRIYARVLEGGSIKQGDSIELFGRDAQAT